jgi:hypothetical protein
MLKDTKWWRDKSLSRTIIVATLSGLNLNLPAGEKIFGVGRRQRFNGYNVNGAGAGSRRFDDNSALFG